MFEVASVFWPKGFAKKVGWYAVRVTGIRPVAMSVMLHLSVRAATREGHVQIMRADWLPGIRRDSRIALCRTV